MLYYFILLLPCFACLFVAMMLLGKWRTNTGAQNLIGVAFLLVALNAYNFSDMIVTSSQWTWRYYINIVVSAGQLMVIPLFIRYFRLLTSSRPLKWWNNLIFAPVILVTLGVVALHLTMGEQLCTPVVSDVIYDASDFPLIEDQLVGTQYLLFMTISLILLAQEVFLIVYGYISVRRYTGALLDFYSNLEGRRVATHYGVLVVMVSLFVMTAALLMVPFEMFGDILGLIFVVMVIYIGLMFLLEHYVRSIRWSALHLGKSVEATDQKFGSIDPTLPTTGRNSYPKDLPARFHRMVEDEKIFLQPQLCVGDVCEMLCVQREYLRRMIGELHGMTFYKYINGRRVKYAEALMLAQKEMTAAEVVSRAGFLSEANFNRLFREKNKVSVQQWRSQNLH